MGKIRFGRKILFFKYILFFSFCFLFFIFYTLYNYYNPNKIIIVESSAKYLHFSLDDVRGCTTRLSSYNYTSIFEDSILSILKQWHNKYGIVVSLYVQGDFVINSKYSKELIDNSYWLKFGYHGMGEWKYDMCRFYKQVSDSIGSYTIIDEIPRLDYFHGNRIICNILKFYGCKGFLSCDDWSYNKNLRVTNYYLSDEQSNLLDLNNRAFDCDNNLYFIKTDFRLEQIQKRWGSTKQCLEFYCENKQSEELIVFTHEWNFEEYLSQADSIFLWAIANGYKFDFPMNQ